MNQFITVAPLRVLQAVQKSKDIAYIKEEIDQVTKELSDLFLEHQDVQAELDELLWEINIDWIAFAEYCRTGK